MQLTTIGVIVRKDKPAIYIDADKLPAFVKAINSNDFVLIEDYQCTVHKFDIEEIKIARMTTQINKELEQQAKKMISMSEKSTLSLKDHMEGLKKLYLK